MSLWERLRYNLGLKVLSLMAAVAIWGTIQTQTDPLVARKLTVKVVPVEVPADLAPVSVEPSQLTVTLFGRASAFERLEEGNFHLGAVVSKATVGSYTGVLRPEDLPNGLQIRNIPRATAVVELDALVTAKRPVYVEVRGHPAPGYAADGWQVTPHEVTVSAPSALVQKLSRIVAQADISGQSATFRGSVTLSARDASNMQVPGVSLHPQSAEVTIPLRQVNSKTVPVVPQLGTVPAGYEVASIDVSPAVVTLTGPSQVLAGVQSVSTNRTAALSARGRSTLAVPLRLPEGCSILGATAVRLTVTLRGSRGGGSAPATGPAPTAPPPPTGEATTPDQPDREPATTTTPPAPPEEPAKPRSSFWPPRLPHRERPDNPAPAPGSPQTP